MSLKKNFIYNGILTASTYIFPLITFPYVSRVLGVTNIGICNFVDSIINYYILFSMMGISIVGTREIAKDANNQDKLNRTFTSLFFLNAITTFCVLIIFGISIYAVPQLYQYKELMYISAMKILFSLFLIEWFYKGIENFRYITVRNLFIRVLYVIAILVFIRHKNDYVAYYSISVCVIILEAIINWQYKKNFVKVYFKDVSLKLHLKPFFSNGLYFVLTSMYLTFNVAYLGFISGKEEVGYYTTATKLYGIFLAVFTAFTGVMLPRMSSLVADGDKQKMAQLIEKSFDILYSICIPLIIVIMMLSPEIIMIIAGKGYEGAIIPMRIITPLLLIVGIAQILVFQILTPLKNDRIILINSIIGASVGLSLNILLVGRLQSVGSALTMVFAELLVLISAAYFVKKQAAITIPFVKLIKNLFYSAPYIFICYLSKMYFSYPIVVCVVAFLPSAVYFVLSQVFVLKNQDFLNLIRYRLPKPKTI